MSRSRARSAGASFVFPVVAGLVALSVTGCGSTAGSATPSRGAVSPVTVGATASPSTASRRPSAPSAPGAIAHAVLVVARPGEPRWRLVDAATGEDLVTNADFTLPTGAPGPRWGRIISASISDDRTVVRDEIVQPGFGGPSLELDGRWRLPTLGDEPLPTGVSPDGSTIVLVEGEPEAHASVTRFAIVRHTSADGPSTNGDADLRLVRTIELPGRFAYDSVSSDGRVLYVVEHLDASEAGRYQVRAVDLPSGVMRDTVIVDKANPDERMSGYPIAQLRRSDGVVMTLYDGSEHPFIHALQANEGWAVCIDLPATDRAVRSGWGLASAPDGRTIYAGNGPAGVVLQVGPDEYAVSRIGALTQSTAGSITFAKFGHTDIGPIGRRVVVLPDGKRLLVATADGVAIVDAASLREIGRIETRATVDSIGVTPDGSVGFALTGDGRIVAFEPGPGGQTFGEVAGGPYAGLVAVAPW